MAPHISLRMATHSHKHVYIDTYSNHITNDKGLVATQSTQHGGLIYKLNPIETTKIRKLTRTTRPEATFIPPNSNKLEKHISSEKKMRAYLKPTPASEEEKRQKLVQQAMEERRKRTRNKNSPSKSPSAKNLRPQAQADASNDQPEPMEEDVDSLADSGGERAERVEMEATFSPDEEEDDHAAKDIEVSKGRTKITMAMPMTGEAPQVEGSIAATPAPKEMRPSPRRIHFAEEVESTSTTPATTRREVHYLVLAPDPWFGPPPEAPLKNGAVSMAVTNAITEKIGILGNEIMIGKAATPIVDSARTTSSS